MPGSSLPPRPPPPQGVPTPWLVNGFRVKSARGAPRCASSQIPVAAQSFGRNCLYPSLSTVTDKYMKPVTDFLSSRGERLCAQPSTANGSSSEGRVSGGGFLGSSSFRFPFAGRIGLGCGDSRVQDGSEAPADSERCLQNLLYLGEKWGEEGSGSPLGSQALRKITGIC